MKQLRSIDLFAESVVYDWALMLLSERIKPFIRNGTNMHKRLIIKF